MAVFSRSLADLHDPIMPTVQYPLAGSLTNRNISVGDAAFSTTDQRFENCYPEVSSNSITGQKRIHLYKRLGMLHSATAGVGYTALEGGAVALGLSGGITGIMSFLSGTTLKLYKASAVLLGTSIAGVTGPGALISETLISGVSNIVIQVAKSSDSLTHAWYYPDGGSFTEITSANYPPNQSPTVDTVGAAAHIDGYMFVMDTFGNIWNSDLNSLANWTATSKVPANAYADGGSGVCRYGDYIVGFGTGSIEFFKNAGNPSGSPLARATIINGIGCISKNTNRSYLNVGSEVYFIGVESDPGRFGIFKLSGAGYPAKVSTPAIDRFLNANTSVRIVGSFNLHGMTHLLLYDGSSAAQPCLCIDTNTWWYMKASSGQTAWNCAFGVNGLAYLTTGKVSGQGIYRSSTVAPAYTDDGTSFSKKIQTEPIDLGTSKIKRWSRLRVLGDVTAGSSVLVEYSDDDYATFNTWGTIDMSSIGSMKYGLTRGGASVKRAFRLTQSANTASRIEKLELEYS